MMKKIGVGYENFKKLIDRAGEWIDNSHYFCGLKIMGESMSEKLNNS